MKRSLLLVIFLILFPPLKSVTFDEIEAKKNVINGFMKEELISLGKKTGNKLMVECKGNGK